MASERSEHEMTGNFLLGISTGWEQAAIQLRKRSGDAFATGKDDAAKLLRDLAIWAEGEEQTARERYEEHEAERMNKGQG